MEAARTSETSVDNHFTRQYNPEDSSEHHTRRRENLKSHTITDVTTGNTEVTRFQNCSHFHTVTATLLSLVVRQQLFVISYQNTGSNKSFMITFCT
jgi:hypothetical protein